VPPGGGPSPRAHFLDPVSKRAIDDLGPALTRRGVLKGLAAGAALAGCRRDLPPPPVVTGPLADIDTFVVVMMENRSFDHLLGALALDRAYPGRLRVDGLRGGEQNLDADGRPVLLRRRTDDIVVEDLRPAWDRSHHAWNAGRNDGFASATPAHLSPEVMTYHDRTLAPFHYALADEYTVCDRWFSSVLGPTWPNRFYLHAGTASGRRNNQVRLTHAPRTIWDALAARGVEARCYYAGLISWYTMAFASKMVTGRGHLLPSGIERFFHDARHGSLPPFSIVDPDFQISDLHPPRRLVFGEAFLASVVRAMEESPQWRRSMLVILYDEHGGFYDHVPPPRAVDPDPAFAQLGFRVPAIVVGPTVRRGAVVSTVFDHTSVLATLRARFGMESLGPRMDAAADLSSCLDPTAASAPRSRHFGRLELRPNELLASAGWDGGHDDMERVVASGRVPAGHVDGRSLEERVGGWLRVAQELDVVRVRG
jgi:phospholipase C